VSVWLGLLLVGIAVLAYLASDGTTVWGLQSHEFAAIAFSAGLFFLIVPGVLRSYSGRAGTAMRDVSVWMILTLALVGGYSYRDTLGQIAYRIAGEFAPPGAVVAVEQAPSGERAVRIRRRTDGHFIASVGINGTNVPMLVDTGASTVVLRHADAKKLGIETATLKFTVPVQTANGLAYAAHVRLRTVGVGPITLTNIDALVAQPNVLKESLLGMSFLSRLRSYEFAGDFLTFRN
jgi:aspartyl protease family protein